MAYSFRSVRRSRARAVRSSSTRKPRRIRRTRAKPITRRKISLKNFKVVKGEVINISPKEVIKLYAYPKTIKGRPPIRARTPKLRRRFRTNIRGKVKIIRRNPYF